MNEIEKTTNSKKIILGFISFAILAGLVVCFVIAFKNHNSGSSTNNVSDNSSSNTSSNTSSSSYTAGTKITTSGTYKISGENTCIVVNVTGDVTLELDNATITCDNGPAINIESGDVTIVLIGENTVTATTTEDLEGAIYSKDDLIFTGTGSLKVTSNYDGIVSKDSLEVNSGTITINASDDAIKGKDSVEITGGTISITAGGDGIKTTNEEDSTLGYIDITGGTFTINSVGDGIQAVTNLTIKDGTFNITTTGGSNADSYKALKAGTLITIDGGTYTINAKDDGIHSNGNVVINKGKFTINSSDDAVHADGMVEINGGTFELTAREGIEATYVKINDGTINISASDDGINAGNKSGAYSTKVEINGGNITITMGQGDTDGVDSNGDIIINGGTISVTGQSTFDYDGTGVINGGTVICNGEKVSSLPNPMMGENQMVNPGGDMRGIR